MKQIHRELEFSERKRYQDFLIMLAIQHSDPEELRNDLLERIQSMDANASGKRWWEHTELDRAGLNAVKLEMKKARESRAGKE